MILTAEKAIAEITVAARVDPTNTNKIAPISMHFNLTFVKKLIFILDDLLS